MLRIVVLGMMGRSPFGGQTWLYLNWLLGLSRLGHEVWYVEDDIVWPYDPEQNSLTDDGAYATRHIAASLERIGLPGRWVFRLDTQGRRRCWGRTSDELDALYRSCDLLLSIVGTSLRDEQLLAPCRVRVETDPVRDQIRLANGDPEVAELFASYHAVATYGENYGRPDCGVPLGDVTYLRTRQPVALDWWPMVHDPTARYFTTIGNYRQRGRDLQWRGDTYFWSKHHEWEKFLDLPSRTRQEFRLALEIGPHDLATIRAHGWEWTRAMPMSLDAFGTYRSFIQGSRAEFTVAKDQNIRLRSGWFSERDACYLASGKPVVTQDTGFSRFLPTGEGLFPVATVEEAAAAIDEINAGYERHCKAARALAEEQFDAVRVAAALLRDLGYG